MLMTRNINSTGEIRTDARVLHPRKFKIPAGLQSCSATNLITALYPITLGSHLNVPVSRVMSLFSFFFSLQNVLNALIGGVKEE